MPQNRKNQSGGRYHKVEPNDCDFSSFKITCKYSQNDLIDQIRPNSITLLGNLASSSKSFSYFPLSSSSSHHLEVLVCSFISSALLLFTIHAF